MPNLNILLILAAKILALSTFSVQARITATAPSSAQKHLPTRALARIVATALTAGKKHVALKNHEHHAAAPSTVVQVPYREFFAYVSYVDKCLGQLTDGCGKEVFGRIFENRSEIGPMCCEKVVNMWLDCGAEILKATLLLPELSSRDKAEIKKREIEVYDQCVRLLHD